MSALKDILAPEPESEPIPPPPPPPPPISPPAQPTMPVPSVPAAADEASSVPSQIQSTELDAESASTPMAVKRKADHLDDDAVATPRSSNTHNENGDDKDEPLYTSTTTSIRHNKNGATSSVYSGNKIRHLKKEDGIPLWRKDIQYDFLKLVFYDQTKCFTKFGDGTKGHTFAEIYIDAMARSSKCSKILKEKLLQEKDQGGAISMAMVCLLVNVGRMNTTLNFFPEMRAQLRTYHSIPALQADQDPNAYKQLQDAPRLKSILKGATEDEPQPSTLEDIKAASIPRTNPVNLIFVMSQYAPKISAVHFHQPRDFFDLVMRSSLSSASRARAFLWLIWWYLESDFTYRASKENPFGPGVSREYEEDLDTIPAQIVPELESLTEEQAEQENVDTEKEKHFGEVKRKERIAILASEPSPAMTALKRARKEKGLTTGHNPGPSDDEGSDAGYHRGVGPTSVGRSGLQHETASDYTRSPSPAARSFQAVNTKSAGDMGINNLLNSDDIAPDQSPPPEPSTAPAKKGPGRGNWRRNKNKEANATPAGAQSSQHIPLLPNTGQMQFVNNGVNGPVQAQSRGTSFSHTGNKLATATGMSPGQSLSFQSPATARDHVPTPSNQAQKRHRGITQHQSAVINHRKMQIDYTLDRRLRKAHAQARAKRESEGSILRAWKRIRHMPPDYDSEEENVRIRKARDRAEKNDDEWRSVHRGKENDDFLDNVELWRKPRILYAGYVRMPNEPSDVGEECRSLAQALRRVHRRLDRWQETSVPAASMEKRLELEKQGAFHRQHERDSRAPSMSRREHSTAGGSRSARASLARNHSSATANQKMPATQPDDRMDVDPPEEEEGAAELDEEDRELLGEVDAEDDEEEDEDMDEDD